MTVRNYTAVTIKSEERNLIESVRDMLYEAFLLVADGVPEERLLERAFSALDAVLNEASVYDDEEGIKSVYGKTSSAYIVGQKNDERPTEDG